MKKIKDKKIVGIVAVVLSILWFLSSLLRVIVGTSQTGSYGVMGFLGNLYSYADGLCGVAEWLLVLIGSVTVGAIFFLKEKLNEKKFDLLKKLVPAVFGILAIKVFFDVFGIIDSFGRSMEGIARILWIALVIIDLLRAAAFTIVSFCTAKPEFFDGKKKLLVFVPAVLMLIHAAITFILRLVLVFAPYGSSLSVSGVLLFVTEAASSLVLALTLGAIGFWAVIPEPETEKEQIEEEE